MAGAKDFIEYLNAVDATGRPNRNPVSDNTNTSSAPYGEEIEAIKDNVQGNLSNIFAVQGGLNEYGLPSFADYINSSGVSSAISSQYGSGYASLLGALGNLYDYNNYSELLAGETAFQRNKELFQDSVSAQKELMRIENEYDSQSAKQAMEFEALEAQKNRDWQTQMSNTAYSRAMNDMVSSGVNPILAFNSGAASTPNGSAASGFSASSSSANVGYTSVSRDNFTSGDFMDLITTGINSATSIERGIMDVLKSVISVVGYGITKGS